jgi:hypothetical protein
MPASPSFWAASSASGRNARHPGVGHRLRPDGATGARHGARDGPAERRHCATAVRAEDRTGHSFGGTLGARRFAVHVRARCMRRRSRAARCSSRRASHTATFSISSRFRFTIDWVYAVDGGKIKLSETNHASESGDSKGASSTATIATYLLLGPLGLFAHNFVHGLDVTVTPKQSFVVFVPRCLSCRAAVFGTGPGEHAALASTSLLGSARRSYPYDGGQSLLCAVAYDRNREGRFRQSCRD